MLSFLQLHDPMEQEPELLATFQFCVRFDDQAPVGPHFPFGRPRHELNCAILHTSNRGWLRRNYLRVVNLDHNRAEHVTS